VCVSRTFLLIRTVLLVSLGFLSPFSANAVTLFGLLIKDNDPLDVTASGDGICDQNHMPLGCTTGVVALTNEILKLSMAPPSAGSVITGITWYCGPTEAFNNRCPGGTTLDGGMNFYAAESQGLAGPGAELSDSFHIDSGCGVGGQNTFCVITFSSEDGRLCPATGCDTFEMPGGGIAGGQPALAIAWSGTMTTDVQTLFVNFNSDIETSAPEPPTFGLITSSFVLAAAFRRGHRR
jgi:hypothetical protein